MKWWAIYTQIYQKMPWSDYPILGAEHYENFLKGWKFFKKSLKIQKTVYAFTNTIHKLSNVGKS